MIRGLFAKTPVSLNLRYERSRSGRKTIQRSLDERGSQGGNQPDRNRVRIDGLKALRTTRIVVPVKAANRSHQELPGSQGSTTGNLGQEECILRDRATGHRFEGLHQGSRPRAQRMVRSECRALRQGRKIRYLALDRCFDCEPSFQGKRWVIQRRRSSSKLTLATRHHHTNVDQLFFCGGIPLPH